ncbi:MAG: dynamin family protein [Akkermansia sp.]|nr:dynamin family protein [Akkermansia sp.]
MQQNSSLSANNLHVTYRSSLLQLADALVPYTFLRRKENELRAIADSLQSPFNVAVFGRMDTGKSTLINALIGKPLAITGVGETTATINRLTYAADDRLNQFTVHWQDSQPENFPLARLASDWTGKGAAVLARAHKTSWLELYSDAPILREIFITDTPGTEATALEHELIAKQFINGQEADALLYVFPPVGRARDEADLQAFRDGCLPGSSLDNSVAVLHKWDTIFWDEDDWQSILVKANRVQEFMQGLVSAVIPVSAPLALLAKTAPLDFWKKCTDVLNSFDKEDELIEVLSGDDDEREDVPELEALYRQACGLGCNISSFRIMLRHLYRHQAKDPKELVYELSGIQKLEQLLDRQILSMRSVIQQRQNCARARRVMDEVYTAIEQELARQQTDIDMMERIYDMLAGKDEQAQRWIDRHRGVLKIKQEELKKEYLNLDILRLRVRDWSEAITSVHDLIPWLRNYEKLGLSEEVAGSFIGYLKALLPNAEISSDLTIVELMRILPFINQLDASPVVEDKEKAVRLRHCLMQWFSQHQHS